MSAMPNPPVSGAPPKAPLSSVPALARPFLCPPTFTNNGSTYLPATRPGLAAAIVPGSPTEAIVCRCADVGTDGGLVRSATLTDTAALVAVFNSATQMQVGASYACAAGTGQLDLLGQSTSAAATIPTARKTMPYTSARPSARHSRESCTGNPRTAPTPD